VTLPDGAVVDAGPPACVPKTCQQLNATCGSLGDGCGGTLDCGTCNAPQTCGGGGTPNACGGSSGCVPKTCQQLNATCGAQGDGCGGTLQCGTCTSPQSCGGGGVANKCGGVNTCTPRTCAQQNADCGPVADGCGGLIPDCGACTSPAICGGGGVPSKCGNSVDGGTGDSGTCTGLCTQQVKCDGGVTTTLTGVVYDPAGKNPLYNAVVYVPNGTVQPFTTGVSCDQCGAPASGNPLVSTITGFDGKFTLTNVPVGNNIPLVIQIGRWRRQVTVNVPACTTTPVAATITRLPRNKGEGDIPLMAIASGNADPFECLLLKMGVDAAEFTPYTGNGRIHFYHENGVDMNPAAPSASSLWGSNANNRLANYDIVYLPCEGAANSHGNQARNRLLAYTALGGRVFTTHYSYAWAQPIWPTVGAWDLDQTYLSEPNSATLPVTVTGLIDTTFPKGKAFADWLQYVNASTTYGQLEEHEARHDIDTVNNPPAQRWIYMTNAAGGNSSNAVQHMTFNTPIDALPDDAGNSTQCGRVVYSDFHVSASALNGNTYFPDKCNTGDLSAQEKALEFMVFDLSSCIQKDSAPPAPPPTCTPRTCASVNANCGPIGDGCGGVLNCGTCTPPQTCGGGGTPNVCGGGCTPMTCGAQGLSCGPAGDGCGNVIQCGNCTPPQTCGGGGTPGVCGAPNCTKLSCVQQNIQCGPAGDGCGGLLQCGTCVSPATCGGGGQPGVCGVSDSGSCAVQSCQAQNIQCGPAGDGCGGLLQCGTCVPPATCGGGGQPGVCGTPQCTPRTCQQANANCGPIADGCGGIVQCGDCTPPATCGGGGTPNQCGQPNCTPRTCVQAGANCGPVADGCGAIINCGDCVLPKTCGGGGVASVCGGGIPR
jgi:hypothetical protein